MWFLFNSICYCDSNDWALNFRVELNSVFDIFAKLKITSGLNYKSRFSPNNIYNYLFDLRRYARAYVRIWSLHSCSSKLESTRSTAQISLINKLSQCDF